jgi:prepilin-type N-terminal cleavage/methylation domain-containing protein
VSDSTNQNQTGFTVPELVVALSIFAILSVGLLNIMTSFFFTIIRNSVLTDMTVTSQNFLRTTEENIRYGAGVRQINTITDANAPPGGWNTSNSIFVIIISVPAVDSARNYIIDSTTGAPYMNELVYYRQDNLLLQRTLAHPGATGNSLLTSCPESLASASCPADKELLENLGTISFVFYDQDNFTTSDPLLARSVEINLVTSKDSFGEPLTLDNKVRVTLRNRFQ